jgi:dihydroneopterin aldolase
MDTVFVNDLRVRTVVGIWEWEKRMEQVVSIDLEMAADIGRAAKRDQIDATLDYKAVSKRVTQFVGKSRFQLVETLAEQVAGVVMSEFHVPWVKVTVRKPFAVRGSRDVGVRIERGGPATA